MSVKVLFVLVLAVLILSSCVAIPLKRVCDSTGCRMVVDPAGAPVALVPVVPAPVHTWPTTTTTTMVIGVAPSYRWNSGGWGWRDRRYHGRRHHHCSFWKCR